MVVFAGATLMVLSLMSCKEFYELMQEQDVQNFLTEISITDCQILKACNIMKLHKEFPVN